MLKHYVIVSEWTEDGVEDREIFGLSYSKRSVTRKFRSYVDKVERPFAQWHNLPVILDMDTIYEAGLFDLDVSNRTRTYITRVD